MEHPLEPIPSPPGHLLREFCHRGLPTLAFAAAFVASALLWNVRFSAISLFGEVETIGADVVAPEAGTLLNVIIDRFDCVTNGQVLGTLEVQDPESTREDLAVMRTELEISRSRMALDQERNEQNVESIRAQWLEARVNLATARVNLQNALRELERARQLKSENILSEAEFDLAKSVAEALEAEVRERTAVVDGLAGSVERLASSTRQDQAGSLDVIAGSIAAQEARMRQRRLQTLRAPIGGIIKVLNHRSGERVAAGTVLFTITAPNSERIVGYVRQPLDLQPKPDMPVEIRTRGIHPQVAHSRITRVGTDLELVASPMRLRGFDNSVERGLPFLVELPPGLEVHPGELVDLIVRPHARRAE